MAYKETKSLKEWTKQELAVIRGIWASSKKNGKETALEPLTLADWESLVAEKIEAKSAPKKERELSVAAKAVYERVAAISGITEEQLEVAKTSLLANATIKSKLYELTDDAEIIKYLSAKVKTKQGKGSRTNKPAKEKEVKDFNKVKIAKKERETLEAIFRKAKAQGVTLDEVVEAITKALSDKVNSANEAEIKELEERLAKLKGNIMY